MSSLPNDDGGQGTQADESYRQRDSPDGTPEGGAGSTTQESDQRSSAPLNRRRFLQGATSAVALPLVANTATAGSAGINVWKDHIDENWWQSPTFFETFDNPIALAGPPTYEGHQPGHCRLRNVKSYSFEVKFEEWDYLNGDHATEIMGGIHFSEGTHETDDGTPMQGITYKCQDYDWTTTDLDQDHFNEDPIVITRPQTFIGTEAIVTRNRWISEWGFETKMQEQEDRKDGSDPGVNPGHVEETIGALAIEPGVGTIDGLPYEAGVTTIKNKPEDYVDFHKIYFDQTYDNPVILADIHTYEGSNTVGLRLDDFGSDHMWIGLEEEQSKDSEIGHIEEVVSYFIVEAEDDYDYAGNP